MRSGCDRQTVRRRRSLRGCVRPRRTAEGGDAVRGAGYRKSVAGRSVRAAGDHQAARHGIRGTGRRRLKTVARSGRAAGRAQRQAVRRQQHRKTDARAAAVVLRESMRAGSVDRRGMRTGGGGTRGAAAAVQSEGDGTILRGDEESVASAGEARHAGHGVRALSRVSAQRRKTLKTERTVALPALRKVSGREVRGRSQGIPDSGADGAAQAVKRQREASGRAPQAVTGTQSRVNGRRVGDGSVRRESRWMVAQAALVLRSQSKPTRWTVAPQVPAADERHQPQEHLRERKISASCCTLLSRVAHFHKLNRLA